MLFYDKCERIKNDTLPIFRLSSEIIYVSKMTHCEVCKKKINSNPCTENGTKPKVPL